VRESRQILVVDGYQEAVADEEIDFAGKDAAVFYSREMQDEKEVFLGLENHRSLVDDARGNGTKMAEVEIIVATQVVYLLLAGIDDIDPMQARRVVARVIDFQFLDPIGNPFIIMHMSRVEKVFLGEAKTLTKGLFYNKIRTSPL